MRFLKLLIVLLSISSFSQNKIVLPTPFEKGNGNQSTTYNECIQYYQDLDASYATIQMVEKGKTDSGKPLHIVIFSENKNFDVNQNKAIVLVNNGIHPGEPDGIDASMMLMRDLAIAKMKVPKIIANFSKTS